MSQTYLVTGANSGLGLDSVRRLAEMKDTAKVYMACRTEQKAHDAIRVLTARGIDSSKLKYAHFDASEPEHLIQKIVDSFNDEELNGLVLNAGGIGHSKLKKAEGPNHVLNVHQINTIGHIQLVEALKKAQKLAMGAKIVFSGSEAARGVPIMMIANPKMGTTKEWYEQHLEGTSKGKVDPMVSYAETKGFAALYFAEWARHNPSYKVWTVSPGGTSGTEALKADAVPGHFKVMMPVMMPVMRFVGAFHDLEDGSARYIDILVKDHGYPSGAFIASKRGTTGKMVDQSTLRNGKKYADPVMQKAAYEALSKYVTV